MLQEKQVTWTMLAIKQIMSIFIDKRDIIRKKYNKEDNELSFTIEKE